MVLREIVRVPLGVFDQYRALAFKQARTMNFVMMYTGFVAVLFFGKGFEKIAVTGGEQTTYESNRRARRFFIPYFLASYKWRFPTN
jgi:hypothetical protein